MSWGSITLQHQEGTEVRDLTDARMSVFWMPSESEDREFDCEIVLSFEAPNPPSQGRISSEEFTPINGEFQIAVEGFSEEDFVGTKFSIPRGYDPETGDYLTRLYYFEHLSPDEAKIEVLNYRDGRYHIQIRALCELDTYDGSSPPSTIVIDGWFAWSDEDEDEDQDEEE